MLIIRPKATFMRWSTVTHSFTGDKSLLLTKQITSEMVEKDFTTNLRERGCVFLDQGWRTIRIGAMFDTNRDISRCQVLECVWNLMAHGDERKGKWRRNWRMEWLASTLTLPRNVVYPALLTLMRTPRLPAVDWTDAPADLNGLVRLGERRNLVSAHLPSRFKCSILV